MTTISLTVKGMHCKSCTMLVKEALEDIGASAVAIALDEKRQMGKVTFEYSGEKQNAISAIEKEGYKIE
ncbi:heavy-metal-associated domain-containing protein [Candidatus Woesearchaeota archaeon]|nr:heavy-metal-associated domain-containing protein [Candidatus Woesearchaeota archaeon]